MKATISKFYDKLPSVPTIEDIIHLSILLPCMISIGMSIGAVAIYKKIDVATTYFRIKKAWKTLFNLYKQTK